MNPFPFPSQSVNPPTSNLAVVLHDDRAIARLIDELLDRSNLTVSEAAERIGVSKQSVHQYRSLRRKRPSIQWLARLVEACGGRIFVELPTKQLK